MSVALSLACCLPACGTRPCAFSPPIPRLDRPLALLAAPPLARSLAVLSDPLHGRPRLQLAPTYDYVAPCFPPAYDIFGAICAEHHRQLCSMVDFIGLCADNLANSDILKVGLLGHHERGELW